jgi:hypothetical protein
MNLKRTVMLGAVGGAIAVWLAAAATSTTTRRVAPIVPARTNVIDKSGAQLAVEIARLHERLRPSDTPLQTRDLFRYAARSTAPRPAPVLPEPLVQPTERSANVVSPLKLVGVAEDPSDAGPARTAIISGFGQLFLVKEGEAVTLRYRVARVSSDAVELTDVGDNSILRLALK